MKGFKPGGQIISTADADSETIFNKALKGFERKHPDITTMELLDPKKPLPGNSRFA